MSDIPLPPPFSWTLILDSAIEVLPEEGINLKLADLLREIKSEDLDKIRLAAIMLCNSLLEE